MQALCIALLAFNALLATAQQPAANSLVSSGRLTIPARLAKTVRADRVHPGDPVEFRTLEAVLVSQDLVMPENTLLRGRILSAGAKQQGRNSWLALVVERADWKQHSLPIHAFIASQITISSANGQHSSEPGSTGDTSSPVRANRQSSRVEARSAPEFTDLVKPPQDAMTTGLDEVSTRHPLLGNIGIVRDKDGTVYLFSSKANVKLPAGVMLMLANGPVASSESADAKAATAVSGSKQ